MNFAHLSDKLIIRDSTGLLKVEKAKVAIVDNSMGGKDTIITILKGNASHRNFNGKDNIGSTLLINSKSPESAPLYIIDGKIAENGFKDILPEEISSINVRKNNSSIAKYGDVGKSGIIVITKTMNPLKALYIIDGITSQKLLQDINPTKIKSIDILKGDAAITRYGDSGRNGVIIITTKKDWKKDN